MGSKKDILATIEAYLKDRKGADFQVSLELDLRKDLQADSVELMEFIIELEDEYQLEIPDKVIEWIVQRLFWMVFFSVLFIRILLILYGNLLKMRFLYDRM